MRTDLSSILPDGRSYEFWETDQAWERELFVNGSDPSASDDNDGSEAAPFRTIGKAAQAAAPGTRVGPSGKRRRPRRRAPGCASTREPTASASAPPWAARIRSI